MQEKINTHRKQKIIKYIYIKLFHYIIWFDLILFKLHTINPPKNRLYGTPILSLFQRSKSQRPNDIKIWKRQTRASLLTENFLFFFSGNWTFTESEKQAEFVFLRLFPFEILNIAKGIFSIATINYSCPFLPIAIISSLKNPT